MEQNDCYKTFCKCKKLHKHYKYTCHRPVPKHILKSRPWRSDLACGVLHSFGTHFPLLEHPLSFRFKPASTSLFPTCLPSCLSDPPLCFCAALGRRELKPCHVGHVIVWPRRFWKETASVLGDSSVLTVLVYSSWEYLSDTHFSKQFFFVVFFVAVLVFYVVVFFGCAGSLFLHLDFSLVVVNRGYSPSAVRGLLIAVASSTLASAVGGARASLTCSMWNLPGPDTKPVSPALAGVLLTTAPLGKSSQC